MENSTTHKIILTSNTRREILVDAEDFESLNKYTWYEDINGYAARGTYLSGGQVKYAMHRALMNPPKDMQIDHINRMKLDNRRDNLRICTNSENQRNKISTVNSTSQYKGVSYNPQRRKWVAVIGLNKKTIWIGRFDKESDAALAYNKKAKDLHGEFALLNIIEG